MNEDDGVYGVVVEWQNQGPILMEAEGPRTSYNWAYEYMRSLVGAPRVTRVAVVRLAYVDGNELLLKDMKRMQQ
jgi:hypothetical protein